MAAVTRYDVLSSRSQGAELYWGKIVGTLVGLATTRPLLVLLGLVLGHQFDRGFAERAGAFGDSAKIARPDDDWHGRG